MRRGQWTGARTTGFLVGGNLGWPRTGQVHDALDVKAAQQRLAVGGADVADV